ncbi:MAG: peroxiredoxin family protein [Gammaproteobacteria bacterium]
MRSTHKLILELVRGLILLCATGIVFAATQLSGERAPDFVLKSFVGANTRLSEYRGDVVVLTFWANWCSDCRAQLSDIRELNVLHGDAGLRPLSVSMERLSSSLREDIASLELGFPMLDDPGLEVSRMYDVESLPVALLIDREGVVREVVQGYERGNGEHYSEIVERLLAE